VSIRRQAGLLLVATLAASNETSASLTSCATPWSNFTGPNGFVHQYTYLGAEIRDYEASGHGGDPTNGGTGVNPNSIDISSASPASPPGPESSVAFGYYDGGTPWSPTDPATLEDDFVFFRMRIGADPRDNSAVGFDSYHWNILFDLNADGYKDYWIDVDGSYGTNGNPDRVQILYDAAHSQVIADPNAARVEQFAARAGVDAGSCGGAGTSHTRTYPAGDGSGDWLLEIQVPMTAFNDGSGNQLLFPDSPVAFVYTTGASNQDPLQKDHMMDLGYLSASDPITFGDVVTPSGAPSIEFTDAVLRPAAYYLLGGDVFLSVTDRLADADPDQPDCITATVTDPLSGDDEPVRLCETGPSTGLFTNRGGIGALTLPRDGASAEGWLVGLQSTTTTLEARWQLVYESAGGGRWAVRYSVDGGASWTTLPARATAGTPYTAVVGGLTQLSFTVQEDGPDPGDTIAFATTAGERLPTTTAPADDDDGAMSTESGRTLYVSYTNVGHYTVTDAIPVLGPCGALVQFTRANGRVTSDYDITGNPSTSDELFVTVIAPSANTNPATAQTITVALASTRTGGDSQTLTLTETGPNTGVFRNTTGLATVVASSSYPVTPGNGRWEDVDGGAVTATYSYGCGGSPQTASTTATLFSTYGGGRVAFTSSTGLADVDLYTPGSPVWVQVSDSTVGSTCVVPPYASGTVRVTVRSSVGDAETLVLYETAPGSGVFRNQRYDLVTTSGSASVSSASVTFAYGQTVAIATGPDVGAYTVQSAAGGTANLDRTLTATRTGIAFAINPLRTQTYDGTASPGDGVLEAAHDGDVRVEYTDCDDGDPDASNDVKSDDAKYNAPALVVNRVLFAPDAPSPATDPGVYDGCQQEMVEVYNQTASPVDATGYLLRDEDLQLDYAIPQVGGADVVLQPGARIVLSIGGYYPDFQAGTTYYVFTGGVNPDGTLPNWLGGPGDADPADQVVLLDPSLHVVDYVGWSGTPTPSVDFLGDDYGAVTAGVWQDDAYRTTAGLAVGQALARTADGVDNNVPADWSVVADSTCDAMIAAYALTRAPIRGLRVDPAGLVEFATGTQSGSRSFRVYGVEDAEGRRRFPLHDRPVAAVVSDSVTPIVYRVETTPIVTPFVAVEETDVHGVRRLMGPFPVEGARLRAQLQSIEARLDGAGARTDLGPRVATGTAGPRLMQALHRSGRRSSRALPGPGRRFVPSAARGVKVRVREAGDVFVPAEALRAQGVAADPRRLQVTAQGRPVPFQAGADGIRFRAQGLSTDWTDRNVYVISWGGTPSASVPLTRSGDAPWPRWVRVEKSYAYVPSLPREADPWQWDLLLTGVGTWPYGWWDPSVGEFDLPGFVPMRGDVPVALRLVGFSAHTHTVHARINGVAVGSVTFEGVGLALLEGEVPAAALQAQGNRLELDYDADVADPETEYGMVYFDHLDFGYPRAAAPGPVPFELLPWDPTCPIRAADYLIVTHADFAEAAARVARAKAAQRLRPTVIDVERAYDAYAGGVPDPNAVAALVRDFAARGGRYVLLVGDDTFDPRDYAGTGAVSFVPSAVRFDEVWGRVPSENGYADVDGDGRPEVAIGRLPVQTPEEANLLAEKIARQRESLSASAGRHLMVVDNRGPGDPPFLQDAKAVPLPADAAVAFSSVDEGVDAARQVLFDGLAAGAEVTHYFGHGGPEVWADEQLLTVEDVASLPAGPPTVLFTWACQSQWYLNLWGPSLNEALLLHPEGGALASFGPAGITTPRQQRALARGVYARFLNGGETLGDAVREAKAEALAADPSTRPAVEGWNLLGDPALRLPAPR
jgi:hypothetical protein